MNVDGLWERQENRFTRELPEGMDTLILDNETSAGRLTYRFIKQQICVTLSH